MWRVAFVVVLTACNPSPRGAPEPDADPCPPPPYPPCSTSCGNGIAEECYVPGTDTCGDFLVMQEQCDGTSVTCQDFGFYGGPITCDTSCLGHWSSCNACAPGTTACLTLSFEGEITALGASGSQFAVATNNHEIAILDANLAITAVSLPDPDRVGALLPTTNGWLAFSGLAFRTVDRSGVLGDAVPSSAGLQPEIAAGPNGTAMLVWFDTTTSHVYGDIVDETGATLTHPFPILPSTGLEPLVIASDGTSFFVATDTRLVRVAGDGTVATTTSTLLSEPPPGGLMSLAWDGTTGWAVEFRDTTLSHFDAQRFDATGALVGAPIAIDITGKATSWTTRAGILYAISSADTKERLLGFDASGTALPPIEVGTGHDGLTVAATPTSLAFAWFAFDRSRVAILSL